MTQSYKLLLLCRVLMLHSTFCRALFKKRCSCLVLFIGLAEQQLDVRFYKEKDRRSWMSTVREGAWWNNTTTASHPNYFIMLHVYYFLISDRDENHVSPLFTVKVWLETEIPNALVVCIYLPITPPKVKSGDCSQGEGPSFLDEALSSTIGPLLASLSAFWLRLSEKASSLKEQRNKLVKINLKLHTFSYIYIYYIYIHMYNIHRYKH